MTHRLNQERERLKIARWEAEGENASARLSLAQVASRLAIVTNECAPLDERLAEAGYDYNVEGRADIRKLITDAMFFVVIGRWPS